jgi:hypothetical protein
MAKHEKANMPVPNAIGINIMPNDRYSNSQPTIPIESKRTAALTANVAPCLKKNLLPELTMLIPSQEQQLLLRTDITP